MKSVFRILKALAITIGICLVIAGIFQLITMYTAVMVIIFLFLCIFFVVYKTLTQLNTTTMKSIFTKFEKGENWVDGICSDDNGIPVYRFQAKLFDKGSIFGINNGRVSKLSITRIDSHWSEAAVNYDRGWDLEPSSEVKSGYDSIMELLEHAPKDRF